MTGTSDDDYLPFEGSDAARKHVEEFFRTPDGRAALNARACVKTTNAWTAKELAAVEAGRKAWEDGADMPRMPEGDKLTPEALFWVGYQERRARDFFARRGMALYPDAIIPRPLAEKAEGVEDGGEQGTAKP